MGFFATSYGKSPCDGIGGTVKRVVCQESLKQVTTGQILDVNLMYSFLKGARAIKKLPAPRLLQLKFSIQFIHRIVDFWNGLPSILYLCGIW